MGECHGWSLLGWAEMRDTREYCILGANLRAFDVGPLAVVCVVPFPMQFRSSTLMTELDTRR